jgi:hypothetical protein
MMTPNYGRQYIAVRIDVKLYFQYFGLLLKILDSARRAKLDGYSAPTHLTPTRATF